MDEAEPKAMDEAQEVPTEQEEQSTPEAQAETTEQTNTEPRPKAEATAEAESASQPVVEQKPSDKPKKKSALPKILAIAAGVIVLGVVGLIAYINLVGFERLYWDEEYSDYKLEYVTNTTIKLGFFFSEFDKLDQVNIKTTCGEAKRENYDIEWDLTDQLGECTITLTHKLKKIEKKYTVLGYHANEDELNLGAVEIDEDSDEDLDYDGLTNKQEKSYKTNPQLADSDMDGLDDKYEIETSKTDPNKADTDGDGLDDYNEIALGLDPNKSDSKGDGQKDGERKLDYSYEIDDVKLTISGTGNIASTTINIQDGSAISDKTGLIDQLYNLHTDGTITEATLVIPYTDAELAEYGLTEDNLTIYYYNTDEDKYEKIETTVDKVNKTLTAKLTHFSYYLVGDSSLVQETTNTKVLFVLDNSWSLYTNEQYKKYTGKEYSGGLFDWNGELDGFDSEGARFTITSNLIDALSGKGYEIGLSEFRSDYANALPIGTDTDKLKEKLGDMNGKFITNSEGTNITNALNGGIDEFAKDSTDAKYIILLTDGQDSSLKSNVTKLITAANEKNIKICAVGFGGGTLNEPLQMISAGTKCKFFASTDVSGLTELFSNVQSILSNDLIDIDEDGKNDGQIIADSGFVVSLNGFSFPNYGSTSSEGGHCFGMATLAQLYYRKNFPLYHNAIELKKSSSYAYDLRNGYFKNYAALHGFSLSSDILKYTFGYDTFGQEKPSDLRTLSDDTLVFSDEYLKEINDYGIFKLSVAKSSLNKEAQLARWGVTYKKAQNIILDDAKIQNNSKLQSDEIQILNAISASFIKQDRDQFMLSSSNSITFIRNLIGTENSVKIGESGFISLLQSRLQNGEAPVISASFSGGLHAINAIKLIQDIKDANHYYIGVYDNNYPDETRYVEITCKKDQCYTKSNSYYSGNKEPIRITVSEEYDLQYFSEN